MRKIIVTQRVVHDSASGNERLLGPTWIVFLKCQLLPLIIPNNIVSVNLL